MHFDLQKIIRDTKHGDPKAFRKLLEHYQQAAYSFAFRILANEEDARDVVQESFINIWRKLNTYDINKNFKSWMYRIVYNKSIDALRSIKRRDEISLDDKLCKLVDKASQEGDIRLENKEAGELIRMMTMDLPEKQKLIFTLRDLQDLNVEETMEICGMKEDVIKSNLYHARKAIREKMQTIMNYQLEEK